MANALRPRFTSTVSNVFRRYQLPTRCTFYAKPDWRCFATRSNVDDEDDEQPTKYTSSRANFQSAEAARKEVSDGNSPLAQTISLLLSLSAFLLYFGYLREENDLDELMGNDLYDTVPGLKESHEKIAAKRTEYIRSYRQRQA